MADHENCTWASVIFERSGSIRVTMKVTLTISEGSTILRGLAEVCLIDQRCQTGLKSTFCGKASATPFCQHLSRDFRSQALSRFFLQVKKAERGLGTRLHFPLVWPARHTPSSYSKLKIIIWRWEQGSSWPDKSTPHYDPYGV